MEHNIGKNCVPASDAVRRPIMVGQVSITLGSIKYVEGDYFLKKIDPHDPSKVTYDAFPQCKRRGEKPAEKPLWVCTHIKSHQLCTSIEDWRRRKAKRYESPLRLAERLREAHDQK